MADKECCCGCESGKMTYRSSEEKKALENRINRLIGQLGGIRGMIEDDRYCVDILMQCAAVTKGFEALEREIFSSHLYGCVARDIREGRDEVIDETMAIVERLMR